MLQTFSNVSVVSAIFDFVYQMVFFPACLPAMASFEKNNKHGCCCCCVTVKPRTQNYRELKSTGWCYLACCTAERETLYENKTLSAKSQEILAQKKAKKKKEGSNFFRDTYTPFLLSKATSIVVIIIYIGYLAACGVLATRIQVGMVPKYAMPDRSDGRPNNVALIYEYFQDFSYEFRAFFDEPHYQYWKPEKRLLIERIYNEIIRIPNVGNDVLSRNWLRSFTNFAMENNFNISTEGQFLYYLREKFFKQENINKNFLKDVRFTQWNDYDNLVLLETDGEPWIFPSIQSTTLSFWALDITSFDVGVPIVKSLKSLQVRYEHEISVQFQALPFIMTETNLSTIYVVVYNTLIQLGAVICVTALLMPVSFQNHPILDIIFITLMPFSASCGLILD